MFIKIGIMFEMFITIRTDKMLTDNLLSISGVVPSHLITLFIHSTSFLKLGLTDEEALYVI